jgi:hypothetical protein
MTVSTGIWVRQILANASNTKGKYAHVCTEFLSFGEMLEIWSTVTGKSAVFVECSAEEYEELWGVAGKEIAQQMKYGETVTDWDANAVGGFVSKKDLGITEDIGFKTSLESLKQLLI